jgi:hypothetical protein
MQQIPSQTLKSTLDTFPQLPLWSASLAQHCKPKHDTRKAKRDLSAAAPEGVLVALQIDINGNNTAATASRLVFLHYN